MINRATLTGRLTRNVDLRYTPKGIAVGNFTLAVDRNFTNRNGQRGTDFINCVIWRKGAEVFANFTHKGSLVGIDGRIQTRSYDNKQGQRVYVTEIVVDNFALLESRAQSKAQGQPNGPANRVNGNAPQSNGNSKPIDPFASNRNDQPKSSGSAGQNHQSSQPGSKGKNDSNGPSGNQKDPFANSGNKKIDISDDDLPF